MGQWASDSKGEALSQKTELTDWLILSWRGHQDASLEKKGGSRYCGRLFWSRTLFCALGVVGGEALILLEAVLIFKGVCSYSLCGVV